MTLEERERGWEGYNGSFDLETSEDRSVERVVR